MKWSLCLVLSCSTIACASSTETPPEKTEHASAATIDDLRADVVFGQRDFDTGTEPTIVSISTTRHPAGLSVGAGSSAVLTVADRGNHRGRGLISPGLTPTPTTWVLGQTNYDVGEPNQGMGPSYGSLSGPTAVAQSSDSRYAIADTDNHRVLVGYYFSGPSYVAGQHSTFNTGVRNSGGISGASLAEPKGVTWWYGSGGAFVQRLWIADSGNHRLLAFTDATFASAAWVIGQHGDAGVDDFFKGEPNDGNPGPNERSLRDPRGMSGSLSDFSGSVQSGFYVADTGNHRVLHFSECNSGLEGPPRPCPGADFVIGQKDFYTADPSAGGISAFSLNTPTAVAMDRYGGVWVADTGHNRVLHFKRRSARADRVLGQPGFDSGAPPIAVSATTLTAPTGVAVDTDGNVYVSDTGANRILRYRFIATVESCDDGDPCTNDSVSFGRCNNVLTSFSTDCFPYLCDTTRRVCNDTCKGTFGGTPGCQSPFQCTTSGKCAQPCSVSDFECRDGRKCVDGWCCDGACRGTCEACNVSGSEGACTPVLGPAVNSATAKRSCTRAGVDDPECAGVCDGRHRDTCVASDKSTACGPETCNDGVATLRGTCDGHGKCVYVKQACAPYACAPNGCRIDCTAKHHCAAGAECIEGQCIPAQDQKIGGVGCSVRDDGDRRGDHTVEWLVALGALCTFGAWRRRRGAR
jgi:MYXO-CTERM domain-containing protein